MDTDTASLRTGATLGLQRALSAGTSGKVDAAAGNKRHFLLGGTLNGLPFPVQGKGLLVKPFADPNRPSFTIDLQVIGTLTNQMATQIGSVDMQFF